MTIHQFAGVATYDSDHFGAALELASPEELAAIRVGVRRVRAAIDRLDEVQGALLSEGYTPLAPDEVAAAAAAGYDPYSIVGRSAWRRHQHDQKES